jgi:glycine cleavage system H protein
MVALLILLTILVFMTLDYFVQHRRGIAEARAGAHAATRLSRHEPAQISYRAPRGVFFTPGHTWIYLEESGTARVGINDLAQSIVGRITSAGARAAGDHVLKGDPILELRHGHRTVTFRAPIDGVIDEINTDLLQRHDYRGLEPFSAAWLYRIRPKDPSNALRDLMLGDAAKKWLGREVQRLKVILSMIAPSDPVLGATLQDGGLPAWGLIDHLSEQEWQHVRETFFE